MSIRWKFTKNVWINESLTRTESHIYIWLFFFKSLETLENPKQLKEKLGTPWATFWSGTPVVTNLHDIPGGGTTCQKLKRSSYTGTGTDSGGLNSVNLPFSLGMIGNRISIGMYVYIHSGIDISVTNSIPAMSTECMSWLIKIQFIKVLNDISHVWHICLYMFGKWGFANDQISCNTCSG